MGKGGFAVDQDDMATDAKGRVAGGDCGGCAGMICGGHQGRRGKRPRPVQVENRLVDAGGEPEVIGVEDEAGHANFSLQANGLLATQMAFGSYIYAA